MPSAAVKVRIGTKEIIALVILIALVIITVINFVFIDTDEMVDPDMNIEVTSTYLSSDPYEGSEPVKGKVWQMVYVNMTNNNEDDDIGVSVTHFNAFTSDGERIWVFNAEDYSYDPIGPGENDTVLLVFMIKENTTLVRLEYSRSVSGPFTCEIPDLTS